MSGWKLVSTEEYDEAFSDYNENRPNELVAVVANLSKYHDTLMQLEHPQKITGKYVHKESKGVKALDESGSGFNNLQATRLYIYPDVKTKSIYLITIGNKKSQKKDIKFCEVFIDQLRSEQNG